MSGFIVRDGNSRTNSHWDWKEEGKPILGVDFHHTISTKCGACPDGSYGLLSAGEPQEGAREALIELQKTFKIIIFTGYGSVASENRDPYEDLKNYLNKYGIPYDGIALKPCPFAFIIDDRAIHHTSWKNTLREIKRRCSQGV